MVLFALSGKKAATQGGMEKQIEPKSKVYEAMWKSPRKAGLKNDTGFPRLTKDEKALPLCGREVYWDILRQTLSA